MHLVFKNELEVVALAARIDLSRKSGCRDHFEAHDFVMDAIAFLTNAKRSGEAIRTLPLLQWESQLDCGVPGLISATMMLDLMYVTVFGSEMEVRRLLNQASPWLCLRSCPYLFAYWLASELARRGMSECVPGKAFGDWNDFLLHTFLDPSGAQSSLGFPPSLSEKDLNSTVATLVELYRLLDRFGEANQVEAWRSA